jgi:3-phosphoshikimate 1-carboxyvinyltransferase
VSSAPTTSISLRPPQPGELRPAIPGSKSLTNRALLLAALARGESTLHGWLDAEDTRLMLAALRTLGIAIAGGDDEREPLTVVGADGPPRGAGPVSLEVGTAGTVARFLLAVLAGAPGRAQLDGSARMRERPMAALVEALQRMGARIECKGEPGALPLLVGPHTGPLRAGELRLARPASSQFVSGLCFAALLADGPTRIVLEQGTPARPYVEMTLAVIAEFGGDAHWCDHDVIEVTPRTLGARRYVIEPDASAASYFLAMAAIWGGSCRIDALGRGSLQGDAGFALLLGRMGADVEQSDVATVVAGTGVLRGGDFDLSEMPDMTLTLAVTALFAAGPTRITGVGILRHHESDRLTAAATELRKLGAAVEVEDDAIVVTPPPGGPRPGVHVHSWDDHRMAMALALVGDVVILAPDCVAKTFPRYFNLLADLGMVRSSRV